MRKLIFIALLVAATLTTVGASAALADTAQDEPERLVVFESFERDS